MGHIKTEQEKLNKLFPLIEKIEDATSFEEFEAFSKVVLLEASDVSDIIILSVSDKKELDYYSTINLTEDDYNDIINLEFWNQDTSEIEAFIINDLSQDSFLNERITQTLMKYGYQSVLALPIISERNLLGIGIGLYKEQKVFVDYDIMLWKLLSIKVADKLIHLRLNTEIEEKDIIIKTGMEKLEKLFSIIEKIEGVTSFEEFETFSKTIMLEASDVSDIVILSLADKKKLDYYSTITITGDDYNDIINLDYWNQTISEIENIVIPNLQEEIFLNERTTRILIKYGYQSVLALPIIGEHNLLGIGIGLYKNKKIFNEYDIMLWKLISIKLAGKLIRLRLNVEIEKKETLFEEVFNKSNDIILIASRDGDIIEYNNVFLTFYSAEAKEVEWIKMPNIFNDKNKWAEISQDCTLYSHQKYDRVFLRDFLHMPKYVSMTVRQLENNNILVIIRDDTAILVQAQQLDLTQNALDSSPITIFITNSDGVILFANKQFESDTGYSPNDTIGQTPRLLKSGYLEPSFYKEMWATILEGKVWKGDIQNKKKNGELYWVKTFITSITNKLSGQQSFVAFQTDITKERELELVSKKRLKELEVWFDVSIGREEKMVDLKHEVRKLKKIISDHNLY